LVKQKIEVKQWDPPDPHFTTIR